MTWTEAEVHAVGLPLYYARDWFVRELERLGSLAAMEAEWGYRNQVLSKWAVRHGKSLKPRLDPQLKVEVRRLRAAGHSFGQIAAMLGIGTASARRLLGADTEPA